MDCNRKIYALKGCTFQIFSPSLRAVFWIAWRRVGRKAYQVALLCETERLGTERGEEIKCRFLFRYSTYLSRSRVRRYMQCRRLAFASLRQNFTLKRQSEHITQCILALPTPWRQVRSRIIRNHRDLLRCHNK